uniref:Uncharacterized protein n=1 Tax=Toxoplasma gondii TgCATBr9 TaxID=943120 RepID=A0A2T6IPL6_TOXGO|nr:hypothetical protein TGBR9_383050 [Toxoplasma gondii TgCATBr9]
MSPLFLRFVRFFVRVCSRPASSRAFASLCRLSRCIFLCTRSFSSIARRLFCSLHALHFPPSLSCLRPRLTTSKLSSSSFTAWTAACRRKPLPSMSLPVHIGTT